MASAARKVCLLLVTVCVAAAAASAQGEGMPGPVKVPRDEVLQRRKEGKPFWDTQWIVREKGVLAQLPDPAAGGSVDHKGLSFVGEESPAESSIDPIVQQLRSRMASPFDARHWLAPLLRCPGSLLGATLAERHFAQLGRDASDVALRQFLLHPDAAADGPLRRREQLDRELAVRLLQQRGVRGAVPELRTLAKEAKDTFLQRAATEALATLSGAPSPSRVPLQSLSIAVPAIMDFWLWIDTGCIATRPDIASASRDASEERCWKMLATYGGAISDAWLAGTQYHVDLPDEVPYEAARTWGRARADQCLLGFRRVDGGWRLVWAAMSGAFEVNVLSAYLDECGGAIESTKDGLHTVNWWPGYEVDVATDHVVVRHESGVGEIGKWPAVVDEAIARRAAIAGELMASKDSPTVPWLLLGGEGVATVQMQPFALSVTSKLSVADATAFCKEQAARVLVADTAWAPGFESLRQLWPAALEAASVTAIQGSDRVRIEVIGKDLDPLLLWPLLQ